MTDREQINTISANIFNYLEANKYSKNSYIADLIAKDIFNQLEIAKAEGARETAERIFRSGYQVDMNTECVKIMEENAEVGK